MTKSQMLSYLFKMQEDSKEEFSITTVWKGNVITIEFYENVTPDK